MGVQNHFYYAWQRLEKQQQKMMVKLYTSVQFSSVTQSCPYLCDPMDCSKPDLPVHHQFLEFTQIHVHWVSDTISFSVVPFSFRLQSFTWSQSFQMSQLFASGGQGIGVRFSISPSNKYSGLISFRMDWLDLLAVQVSLKSLLQDHSLEASVLQHSVFFMVQLSHPYMTTGKTIALSTGTFVDKRMSPFFNTQSCFGALGKCKAFSEGWSCLVGYSQTVGVVSTARSSDGGPQKIHSLLDWWPLHWVEGARDLSLRTYSIILSCV